MATDCPGSRRASGCRRNSDNALSKGILMKRLRKFDLAKFAGVARLTTGLVLTLSISVQSLGAEHLDGRSAKVVGNEAPEQQAGEMLRAGIKEGNTGKRTQAVRALRLLPCNPEATEMALTALQDPKPQVRAAAATALGLMGSNQAIPALKKVLSDQKPAVVLAAAHSLQLLNDPAGYQVYYEILTGERKPAEGSVAQQMETLEDRKKMMELGLEEGLGFVPFADMGLSAAKAIRKGDASPARATAARALVHDSDPGVGQALIRAAFDKSWVVRVSALVAIAKRNDSSVLNAIVPALSDKNQVVRFTAAAAVIRLTTVAAQETDCMDPTNVLGTIRSPNEPNAQCAPSSFLYH
jgi:HEAT repeat protein